MIPAALDRMEQSGSRLLAHHGKLLEFRQVRRERNAADALEFVVLGQPVRANTHVYSTDQRTAGAEISDKNGRRTRQTRLEIEKAPFGEAGLSPSWEVFLRGRWLPLFDVVPDDATFDAAVEEGA